MQFITPVVSCAGFIAAPVRQEFGYVISHKSYVDKLKNEVEKLTADRSDKQRIVEDAKKRGEDIAYGVQVWLGEVETTIRDANKLINEDNEGGGEIRCFIWPCPDLRLRRKLSMEAEEMAKKIFEIMDRGRFQIYSFPAPPQMRAPPQMTASPSARGYEALKSRTSMLDEIMQALEDPNIYMIGVHGMGGVGKTTLVKQLESKAKEDSSFDAVVRAKISNTPNLRIIQGQLADGLDLKLDKETEEGRAGKLRGTISRKKSILVILDDIWDELDLAELGVPYGDDHKGCRLVLTSRNLNVLNKMDTQRNFPLEVLSEEESWNLFEKKAGNVVKHDRIKPIAVEVTKCCSGLPLLIVTVAKALKKKEDVRYWQDSLRRLQNFDPADFHKSVYETLEFSYDCLESEELKSLFLLIGSFEDVFDTEELIPICWGLGLYKDVGTLTEARNRHYTLVKDLGDSSLLLEGEMERVRMHDLVRDVAKSIASRTHPTYAVKSFTDMNEWPKIDQLRKYHHIILPDYGISELPENLECPELKLLVLKGSHWRDYLKVQDDFFSEMREAKVLHLCGMKFTKSPPPSLGLLANLRLLKLSGEFEDIAIVGKLRSLEILMLEDWKIEELPKEIGHLTHLRMLDFSKCRKLRLIPKNLLSSLKCLEELYMAYCTIEWEVEGSNNDSNNASLGELTNLHRLTTLELTIKDGSILPTDFLHFAKLERYDISIGSQLWLGGWSSFSRSLRLCGASTEYNLRNDRVKVLLTRVEYLHLAELECVGDILPGLNGNGFTELRHLIIRNSARLLHIINSDSNQLHHAFPQLEILNLGTLNNMKAICHGPLPTGTFDMLKTIKVVNCIKLENLLLWSHVRHLSQLREMEISECESMKEIIAKEIHEIENIELPELQYLFLEGLPKLLSLCSVPSTIDMRFVPLVEEKVAMPNLTAMVLSGINTCKIWDDNLSAHSCIQNLTCLTVRECGSLTSLFPSSVARALEKLVFLEISSCQNLEKIFVQEENLENHHSSLNLHSSEQVILPNLRTLLIDDMDNLKSLWCNQLAPNSFYKLNEMQISRCPKLLNVLPSSVLSYLINLETLEVIECDELGVIFEIQELSTVATSQQGLATHLRKLRLDKLPKLKYIWSKDPHGILRFQNLCKVHVWLCDSLDHVFPISVAEDLQQLQQL